MPMFAQFFSIVLVNTFSWLGGQGYCAYDFALVEDEHDYANVEIVLRPQFDPNDTATGNTELEDATISLPELGGARVNSTASAKIETDCNIKGLTIVSATASEEGRAIDLLSEGRIAIDTYKPIPIQLGAQ
jgi:hypothetical protein